MSKDEHMTDETAQFSSVVWKLRLRECIAAPARDCYRQQDW